MKFMTIAHSLTAIGTIFAPLLTREFILPYIFHPYRWGGIPFVPPSAIGYTAMYLLFITLIVGIFATISGMMSTAKECKKVEFWTSAVSAKWPMLFALIGSAVLYFLSVLKAPLLVIMAPVPYSNLIVTGIMLSMFVVFGHYIGNNYNIRDVCDTQLNK